LEDHLDELAHHYGRSDNTAKAVEYLGRAGQQAAQRSAYGDAIRNLAAAIDLLHKLPDSPERTQRELQLQLAVGPALIAIRQHLHRYAQARGCADRARPVRRAVRSGRALQYWSADPSLFAVVSVVAERAHWRHQAPHFIGEISGRKGRKPFR
jgi:predicted ATPase